MKRLSVRLSIVAAVIAIGGSTIAYNIWWKGDKKDKDQAGKTAQNDGEDDNKSVTPIPTPEDSEVKPPARSMFEGGGTLKTVSHEEGVESPASGLSIPPDPTYGPGSGTKPPEPAALPTMDTDNASPVGNSGGGFPVGDGSFPTPPPSPAFGGSPTGNLGNPPPVVSLGDNNADLPASDIPKPPTQMSIGDVPEALPPGGDTVPPDTSLTGTGSPVNDTPTGDTGGFPTAIPDKPAVGGGLALGAAAAGAATGAAAGFGQAGSGGSFGDDPPAPATDPLPPLGGSAPDARSGLPTQPPAGPADTPNALERSGAPIGSATPRSSDAFGDDNPNAYGRAGVAPAAMGGGLGSQPSVYGDATAVAASSQASNTPGDRQLEGQQMPALAVEKTAPVEVQVDQLASFEIHIRNTGSVPAHQVMVVDQVPRGAEFVDSTPRCTRGTDGTLIWQVGTIEPGDQVTITTKLLPKVEGEIGSVAQVAFQAHASVRTVCTRPELKIEQSSETQVLIGQSMTLDIIISNVGSGVATGVVLENDVPAGFTHPAGRELEQALGDLQPNEQTRVQLTLTAAEAGLFANRLVVRGEGNITAQDAHEIQVIAPQLQISVNGPSRRYLDRPATYTVELANPGTAPATNVELVTYLPKGMKYVTSDNQGQYDSQSHAVYWSLQELPAQKKGGVSVTTLPIEPGDQKLRVDSKADLGLGQTYEHPVSVEGRAELEFTVADLADPIEVGADCSYEIRLHNRGSRADSNIRLAAEIPAGMKFDGGDGPTEVSSQGQTVIFAPLAELKPDEEVAYRIRVQGSTNGDHVLRVQVQSDELRVPVTKEEITRVYSDK